MCWVKGAVSKIEGKVDGLSDRVAAGYVTKEIFASLEKDVGENKNSIKKIEGMFTGLLVKVLGGVVTLLIGAYVAFREFVSK